jgi:hypothetical protein
MTLFSDGGPCRLRRVVVLFFVLESPFHPIFLPGPISDNKTDGKGNGDLNSINDGREMPGQSSCRNSCGVNPDWRINDLNVPMGISL